MPVACSPQFSCSPPGFPAKPGPALGWAFTSNGTSVDACIEAAAIGVSVSVSAALLVAAAAAAGSVPAIAAGLTASAEPLPASLVCPAGSAGFGCTATLGRANVLGTELAAAAAPAPPHM